jgi:hypothetical protein
VPGRDIACADWVDVLRKHDWYGAAYLSQHWCGPAGASQNDIWAERNQFCRVLVQAVAVVSAPTVIYPQVAADGPTRLLQSLQECRDVGLRLGLVRAREHEYTDASYAIGLLRMRRERPRRCRAAEQRDELAALHASTFCLKHILPT